MGALPSLPVEKGKALTIHRTPRLIGCVTPPLPPKKDLWRGVLCFFHLHIERISSSSSSSGTMKSRKRARSDNSHKEADDDGEMESSLTPSEPANPFVSCTFRDLGLCDILSDHMQGMSLSSSSSFVSVSLKFLISFYMFHRTYGILCTYSYTASCYTVYPLWKGYVSYPFLWFDAVATFFLCVTCLIARGIWSWIFNVENCWNPFCIYKMSSF